MLKFRPSNISYRKANIHLDELQLIAFIEKAINDKSLRGFLYKRSSPNSKWRLKWFLLYQNLLFYFDLGQSVHQQIIREHQAKISDGRSTTRCGTKSASSTPSKAPFEMKDFSGQISSLSQLSLSPRRLGSFLSRKRRRSQPPKSLKLPECSNDNNICRSIKHETKGQQKEKDNETSKSTEVVGETRTTTTKRKEQDRDNTLSLALSAQSTSCQQQQRRASVCPVSFMRPSERMKEDNKKDIDIEADNENENIVNGDDYHDDIGANELKVKQARSHRLASDPSARTKLNSSDKFIQRHQSNYQMSYRLLSEKASPCCSISGVSLVSGGQSPLIHEQQSIGRSATTNNINLSSSGSSLLNLNNLLNSKIGVILLESSYCERLVDSSSSSSANLAHKQASESSIPFTNYSQQQQGVGMTNLVGNNSNCAVNSSPEKHMANSSAAIGSGFITTTATTTTTTTTSTTTTTATRATTTTTTATTTSPSSSSTSSTSSSSGATTLENGKESEYKQQQQKQQQQQQNINSEPFSSRPFGTSPPMERTTNGTSEFNSSELDCIFTLTWARKGSKKYQFRTETEAECRTWVHAISNARYSALLQTKENLEQKYLHLAQIVESESTTKWQYFRQCEELSLEVEKLKQEIRDTRRQDTRANLFRLVLSKSAAIVESIVRQEHDRAQQQQLRSQLPLSKSPQAVHSNPSKIATSFRSSIGLAKNHNYTRANTSECLSTYSHGLTEYSNTNSGALYGRSQTPIIGYTSSADSRLISRAKSMDQEQDEHEKALRRVRRLSGRCGSPIDSMSSNYVKKGMSMSRGPIRARSVVVNGSHQSSLDLLLAAGESQFVDRDPLEKTTMTSMARNRASPISGHHDLLQDSSFSSNSATKTGITSSHGQEMLSNDYERRFNLIRSTIESTAQSSSSREHLRSVVRMLIDQGILLSDCILEEAENSSEIQKIKKVQGFFRGWLCRRRWKQIVQEYIKSPHAESMRKRNNLVFRMVEAEEEYVGQLTLLASSFLRPFKMAASSSRPALSHDELNSIFLNAETLLFLHQIFLKGLMARMDSWPTLVLADLFNMLLPMLTIYQEYIRNHHYSLQVLAECKQREQFCSLLARLEEKPQLNGRSLETFLTYPMHQIPRYIICLHEILAHTPHNHVERSTLYEAQGKLEELSRLIHDEVSETENIRQNLAIERLIIGGCDILLETNQVFIRQGILAQFIEPFALNFVSVSDINACDNGSSSSVYVDRIHGASVGSGGNIFTRRKSKSARSRSRLSSLADWNPTPSVQSLLQQFNFGCNSNQLDFLSSSFSQDIGSSSSNNLLRHCFLFTNHLILCVRSKDGKLQLLENIGRIPVSGLTLIEDPLEFFLQQKQLQLFQDQQHEQHLQQQQQQQYQQPIGPQKNEPGNCWPISNWSKSLFQQQQQSSQFSQKSSNERASVSRLSVGPICHQNNQEGALNASSETDQAEIQPSQAIVDQPTPTKKATSSRSSFASYLANKLSNLTGLNSNQTQSQNQAQAQAPTPIQNAQGPSTNNQQSPNWSSAPPSPINRWHRNQQQDKQSQGPSQSQSHFHPFLNQSPILQQLGVDRKALNKQIQLAREFNGCDFILLLEPPGSSNFVSYSSVIHSSCGQTSATFNMGVTSTGSAGLGASNNHSLTDLTPASGLDGFQRQLAIHLVAQNLQEKAAWMSDISQCIDNVHFNNLFQGSVNDSSSFTMSHSVRTDPRLYKDDVDIKFSRALNSCKLPQIRYATKERLFERLKDLRFLSIDFLNTFLLTYRVFATGEEVLEALKNVHYHCDRYFTQQQQLESQAQEEAQGNDKHNVNSQQNLNDSSTNISITQQKNPRSQTTTTTTTTTTGEQANQRQVKSVVLSCDDPIQIGSVPKLSRSQNLGQTRQSPPLPPNQLLLPSPTSILHKRRSTINSLSPITGSNSSSLVNLVTSNKSQGVNSTKTSENIVTNSASSQGDYQGVSETLNEVNESSIQSPLSNDDNIDDSMNWLERQESLTIPGLDRGRSSSMSHYGVDIKEQINNRAPVTLEIPSCRQTRASSVGHIPLGTDHLNIIGSGRCEHWRMTFRKSNKANQQPSNNDEQQKGQSTTNLNYHDQKKVPDGGSNEFQLKLDLVGSDQAQSSSNVDITSSNGHLISSSSPHVPPSTPIEPKILIPETKREEIENDTVINGETGMNDTEQHDMSHSSSSISVETPMETSKPLKRKGSKQKQVILKEIDLIGARAVDTSADEDESEQSVSSSSSSSSSTSSSSSNSNTNSNSSSSSSSSSSDRNTNSSPLNNNSTIEHSVNVTKNQNDIDAKNSNIEQEEQKPQQVCSISASKTTASLQFSAPFKGTESRVQPDPHNVQVRARRKSAVPQFNTMKQGTIQEHDQPLNSPPAQATSSGPPPLPRRSGPQGSISSCSNRSTIPRGSCQQSQSELAQFMNHPVSKAGVVVTSWSPKVTSRRSSNASAVSAFAAATAASDNPILTQPPASIGPLNGHSCAHKHTNIIGDQHSNLHQQQQRQSYQRISNLISDASSSLCNSRASSRLSSSAGLEGFSGSGFSPFTHSQSSLLPTQNTRASACSGIIITDQQQQRQQQTQGFTSPVAGSPCSSRITSKRHSSVAMSQATSSGATNSNGAELSASGFKSARAVATSRVLSVLRNWLSKHPQDFISDPKLSQLTRDFLQELIDDPRLLTAEHKSAIQLHQMVEKAAHSRAQLVDLDVLLAPPKKPPGVSIETLSALDIAEGMTYLDHKIFLAIRSEEFLSQAWMKPDKAVKAPHILLMTKRFNDVSRLVASEIVRVTDLHRRVAVFEKWAAVAHICRVVHNFNGVLQICAAFTNSAVFRLRKTWEKLPKSVKATVEALQSLVSTDSRFRNMREAINRCDPPSIPYVGMYLTDLSFIEEGTPNVSPDGLLNFSKMRMVAHVIREIQHLQKGNYKIEFKPKVAEYLLDSSRHLQDDEMYRCSLSIEPRQSSSSAAVAAVAAVVGLNPTSSSGSNAVKINGMTQAQSGSGSSSQTQAQIEGNIALSPSLNTSQPQQRQSNQQQQSSNRQQQATITTASATATSDREKDKDQQQQQQETY